MNQMCPLCHHVAHAPVEASDSREYLLCNHCRLITVPPCFHPDDETAKSYYLTHENGIQYPGYVAFLNKAIHPTLPFLPARAEILDYGSGPGPTLSILLEREGHMCRNYDPLFFPDLPSGPFDAIFATECFEHFANPRQEMSQITSLLKPGGVLTIMTILWLLPERFRNWHYTRDMTHISFYHRDTIRYLCKTFGYQVLDTDKRRLFVLKKMIEPDIKQYGR